jgi:hypothetical protein
VQGAQEPERHVVVGGENGRHVVAQGQFLPEPVAGGGRPVADPQRRNDGAGLLERGVPGHRAPPRGVGVLGAGDMPDRAMAQPEQMLGRGPGARRLVVVDGGEALLGVAVGDDDGDAGRRVEAGAVEDLGLDEDDAVDGLAGELGEGLADGALGLRLGAGHVDGVAGGGGGPGDGFEGPRVAVGAEVEGDDAEHVEVAGGQGARGAVALVAEDAHGGDDPVAGVAVDVGPLVGHARHRLG